MVANGPLCARFEFDATNKVEVLLIQVSASENFFTVGFLLI